ncbi:MAG: hypothetical protein KKE24_08475 [Candidatus Thermoplasmatota archaeon]|nr:hypothetical protein [Candidatus Thermoplasmatota archaeon]
MIREDIEKSSSGLSIFMDLLGHDIQNSNQAVLSYLELILSSPAAGEKTKKYAMRAASQIRTSSILVDNMKTLMSIRDISERKLPDVDLKQMIEQSAAKLQGLFLDRRINVDSSDIAEDTTVPAGTYADELFDSLLMNIVHLSKNEEISIKIDSQKDVVADMPCWRICIRASDMNMPTMIVKDLTDISSSEDLSKIVRISGIYFAGTMAKALGGRLEMTVAENGSGCTFTLILRMSDTHD